MTATQPTVPFASIHELLEAMAGIARIDGDGVEIIDGDGFREGPIDRLIATAVFG